jgi:hypothetical protein
MTRSRQPSSAPDTRAAPRARAPLAAVRRTSRARVSRRACDLLRSRFGDRFTSEVVVSCARCSTGVRSNARIDVQRGSLVLVARMSAVAVIPRRSRTSVRPTLGADPSGPDGRNRGSKDDQNYSDPGHSTHLGCILLLVELALTISSKYLKRSGTSRTTSSFSS